MAPVIEVRGLRKSYGDLEAVRGIDLEVAAGEVFALLGPNGAGKTTTVEILEGYRSRSAGDDVFRVIHGADELADAVGWADLVIDVLPGTAATVRLFDADVLAAVDGRGATVVAVGHQPDCGHIAAALGGGPEPPFPAGGMAVVDVRG